MSDINVFNDLILAENLVEGDYARIDFISEEINNDTHEGFCIGEVDHFEENWSNPNDDRYPEQPVIVCKRMIDNNGVVNSDDLTMGVNNNNLRKLNEEEINEFNKQYNEAVQ